MTEKTLTKSIRNAIQGAQDRLDILSTVLDTLPEDLPGALSRSNMNSLWVDVKTLRDFKIWRRRLGRRLFKTAAEPFTNDQGVVRYTYSLAVEEWPDEVLVDEGKYYYPESDGLVYCELLINITPSETCRKVKIGEKTVDLFRYECGDDNNSSIFVD